jgi:hypothetical protein
MVWPVAGRIYEESLSRQHAQMQRHLSGRQDAAQRQRKTINDFGKMHQEICGTARKLFGRPRSTNNEVQNMAFERSNNAYLMAVGPLRSSGLVLIR